MDDRYDALKNVFARRLKNLKGGTLAEAKAMMDADTSDSDGDGMSNLLERAFGGDSLGPDDKRVEPRMQTSRNGKQRITFVQYGDDYNEEGIEYIVERSTDLRTWLTSGISQVDLDPNSDAKGSEIGGGMERVTYETDAAVANGQQQYLRLRIKTK